jgi:hypothetical protein
MKAWKRTTAFILVPVATLVLVASAASANNAPTIKISPGNVSPGGDITVSGKGWPSQHTLRIASTCITGSPITVVTSGVHPVAQNQRGRDNDSRTDRGGAFSVDAQLAASVPRKCTIEVCDQSDGTYGRCRYKTFKTRQNGDHKGDDRESDDDQDDN